MNPQQRRFYDRQRYSNHPAVDWIARIALSVELLVTGTFIVMGLML